MVDKKSNSKAKYNYLKITIWTSGIYLNYMENSMENSMENDDD